MTYAKISDSQPPSTQPGGPKSRPIDLAEHFDNAVIAIGGWTQLTCCNGGEKGNKFAARIGAGIAIQLE
jgi:hypothetical protein